MYPTPVIPRYAALHFGSGGLVPRKPNAPTGFAADGLQKRSRHYKRQLEESALSALLANLTQELDNGLMGTPTMIADGKEALLELNGRPYQLTMVGSKASYYPVTRGYDQKIVLKSQGKGPKIKMTLVKRDYGPENWHWQFRYQCRDGLFQNQTLKTSNKDIGQKAEAFFQNLAEKVFAHPIEKPYYDEVLDIKKPDLLY